MTGPPPPLGPGIVAVRLIEQGREALGRRRFTDAASLFHRAATLSPDDAGARGGAGLALFHLGRLDEALAEARAALDRDRACPEFHALAAAILLALDRPEEAAAAARAALGHGHVALENGTLAAPRVVLTQSLCRLGRLDEALAEARAALDRTPAEARAHAALGLALALRGRRDAAEAACDRALALAPDLADAHYALGLARLAPDRLDGAAEAFQAAIARDPGHFDAWIALGAVALDRRQPERAADAFRAAIALRPHAAGAHYNLGNALLRAGDPARATAAFTDALALRPDYLEARNNLGNAWKALGRPDRAEDTYRAAQALAPADPGPRYNLALALMAQGRASEAETALRAALDLRPDYAEAWNTLAAALVEQDRPGEALTAADRAHAAQPAYPEALVNRGNALMALGHPDRAAAAYRAAIALMPEAEEAHYNLGHALLQMGDLPPGWREYEWRFRLWRRKGLPMPAMTAPRWQGEPLAGKTLLLWAEQGYGDTLHFARYATLAAARGARVILAAMPALARLLATVPGVARVVTDGDPAPAADFQCPLLSAPGVLGTTLATIPAAVPYLTPDPARVQSWRARLAGLGRMRVGLAWAGKTSYARDRLRSLDPALLAPLARAGSGIVFVALQPRPAGAPRPPELEILDVLDPGADFADTAALIAALDLVISVDTAAAHLAGALGKPVWVLTRFNGDWRWLLEREDSPWYPTARLFRQAAPGAWTPAIARVAEALARMVEKKEER
jgi:tetratricopeptide (TPR) repeat protein